MQEAALTETSSRAGGLLSSFVRNIGVNVMGTQSLVLEDIQSALDQLKKKLMERNVAEEIATRYYLGVAGLCPTLFSLSTSCNLGASACQHLTSHCQTCAQSRSTWCFCCRMLSICNGFNHGYVV